jgi:hypothetical protein
MIQVIAMIAAACLPLAGLFTFWLATRCQRNESKKGTK